MQENIKTRREALRVACEEIKKLRTDTVHEGESMDKTKSHVLYPESLEEFRNLESQEPVPEKGDCFGTNGWSIERRNDGGDCQLECGSGLNRVGDLRKRKFQEALEKENTRTTSRCPTRVWTDWMALCHRKGARVDVASSTRMGNVVEQERGGFVRM